MLVNFTTKTGNKIYIQHNVVFLFEELTTGVTYQIGTVEELYWNVNQTEFESVKHQIETIEEREGGTKVSSTLNRKIVEDSIYTHLDHN